MKSNKLVFAFLILWISEQAQGTVQTVGPSSDCDFDTTASQTLQQAVTTVGATEIRLVTGLTYTGPLTIDKPIQITGGFDNCIDASQNIPSQTANAKSILSGQNVNRVIEISNCSQGIVNLTKLQLSDGDTGNLAVPRGAGINTTNSSCDLQIIDSDVSDNTALVGSGVFYDGLGVGSVFIQDSFFYNNTTPNSGRDAQGAGIYSFSSLTVVGNSGFYNNTSGRGGAIYIRGDRYPGQVELTIIGGDDLPNVGFFQNTVFGFLNGSFGGAIYMTELADANITGHRQVFNDIEYGDDRSPVKFEQNRASASTGRGGGIYLTKSSLNISNSRFKANTATATGGAIAYDSQNINTQLTIDAKPSQCWRDQGCNEFTDNLAAGGGAFWAINQAIGHIKHSYFSQNSANTGTSFAIGSNAEFMLENSIIYQDGLSGISYLDRNIIHTSDASITTRYSTLVDNDATEAIFNSVNGNTGHEVYNSIIYNDNTPAIADGTVNSTFDCVLADRQGSQLIDITPSEFVDLFPDISSQNFRLSRSAVAVDLCNDIITANIETDIQGLARGYDLVDVPNISGAFDAGANEFNDDLIFKSNFE